MYYKTAYCFTAWDLYNDFNYKQIKVNKKTIIANYGVETRQELCGRVLVYLFYLIISDIIKNNITFIWKIKTREMMIHVKSITGENFKQMYRKGCFMGIDFLSSNFTGYQICFRYDYKSGVREKPLYINSKLKDIFYANINDGKQYY